MCVSVLPTADSSYAAQLREELRESQRRVERAEMERDSLDSRRKLVEDQLTHSKR